MKQTNCPNCGAPYDLELTKCPYCGTSYFDLSFIDFDAVEPFYIKIRREVMVEGQKRHGIFTICVLPEIMETEITHDYAYVTGPHDAIMASCIQRSNISLNLGFRGVPNQKGEIVKFEIRE